MKGLIIKDFYVAKTQVIMFSLMILYFTFMGGSTSLSVFPIVCAAMLPFTAMSYDEHSKWDSLVKMMPYSRTEIVSSKYIFGYLIMLILSIITVVVKMGINLYKHQTLASKELLMIGFAILFGSLILSISMPLMYGFGTEKGRLLLVIFPVALSVGFISVGEQSLMKIISFLKNIQLTAVTFIIIGLVVNLVSVFLSTKIYKTKEHKA